MTDIKQTEDALKADATKLEAEIKAVPLQTETYVKSHVGFIVGHFV